MEQVLETPKVVLKVCDVIFTQSDTKAPFGIVVNAGVIVGGNQKT